MNLISRYSRADPSKSFLYFAIRITTRTENFSVTVQNTYCRIITTNFKFIITENGKTEKIYISLIIIKHFTDLFLSFQLAKTAEYVDLLRNKYLLKTLVVTFSSVLILLTEFLNERFTSERIEII